jgi:hypothetical protein
MGASQSEPVSKDIEEPEPELEVDVSVEDDVYEPENPLDMDWFWPFI